MKNKRKKRTALITGITGQDGSYLAEFLLDKGYLVYGLCRRVSYFNRNRIEHLRNKKNFKLVYGDLSDLSSLMNIIKMSNPDEIYNLAAQSHVYVSFNVPEYTTNVNSLGLLRILDCVKNLGLNQVKIYQASTSEMFGNTEKKSIDEKVNFSPVSPYGAAKMFAYYISEVYSKSYGLFIANGILFNHESPRRGINFVSKKITTTIAKILANEEKFLVMGNLDAKRDWGYAKDYIEAMWKMLQLKEAENFVISTNKCYSVRQFIVKAFWYCNISIRWKGKGLKEVGLDQNNNPLIRVSSLYHRPQELHRLQGNFNYAKKKLKWQPKTNFNELIKIMLIHDLKEKGIDINKYPRLKN